MATEKEILTFNIDTEEIETIYNFQNPLSEQPEFFLLNDSQTCMIVGSDEACVYIDMPKKKWIELD